MNPDLVVRDQDGKVNTVRYEAVNAMLLNEFLKEHRKVGQQESTIDQLKAAVAKQQEAFGSKIAQQQKQIEALAAGLQKVSAAVELNKPSLTQSRRYSLSLSRQADSTARARACAEKRKPILFTWS